MWIQPTKKINQLGPFIWVFNFHRYLWEIRLNALNPLSNILRKSPHGNGKTLNRSSSNILKHHDKRKNVIFTIMWCNVKLTYLYEWLLIIIQLCYFSVNRKILRKDTRLTRRNNSLLWKFLTSFVLFYSATK